MKYIDLDTHLGLALRDKCLTRQKAEAIDLSFEPDSPLSFPGADIQPTRALWRKSICKVGDDIYCTLFVANRKEARKL